MIFVYALKSISRNYIYVGMTGLHLTSVVSEPAKAKRPGKAAGNIHYTALRNNTQQKKTCTSFLKVG